jgi:hypothetical protein
MILIRIRHYWRPAFAATMTLATLAAIPSAASAHFIWATVEKGQVRFALLENVNEAPSTQFAKYVAELTPRCGDKTLKLGETQDGARFAAVPSGQKVITAESTVGAKEREGKPYLLIYNAKGAVSLAAAGTLVKAPAEILVHKDGSDLVVSVMANAKAVADAEVWVQWPGSDDSKSIKTDAKGDAHFAWPAEPHKSGFVGVRAMVDEARAGELDGKSYASIHRWATLSFPSEGAKSGSKTVAVSLEDKPLTRLLREAYGSNHEIAGKAAFNQTLFAGKVTREQIEAHLQQRAIIHSELHRILNAAANKNAVPYGATQKKVLVFLFDDLITMGSEWPAESKALPLTRDFLKEIRESEAKGPYYALGVWHVYYGGITNGGRMIGEKIGDTLKFQPTYYEKSDGYREYLPEVNKITAPAAQQEMIRGGKAAYKYIIAVSNEAVFQSTVAQK